MGFDYKAARQAEKERQLKILGDLVNKPYDYLTFLERAEATGIPFRAFMEKWRTVKEKGPEALVADLPEMDEASLHSALERRTALGDVVDHEFVDDDDIEEIAHQNGWLKRRAERWVLRYRVDGLWGVSPHGNPLKEFRKANKTARGLGPFGEKETREIYRRYGYIEPLLSSDEIKDEAVEKRAEELRSQGTSITGRTLWNYIRAYRHEGMAGLGRKQRSDKGKSHAISEELEIIIHNLRLSGNYKTVEAVYKRAKDIAQERCEPEPSWYKVAEICRRIPQIWRDKADGKINRIPGSQRITGPINEEGMVIQIDTTRIDVMVLDMRSSAKRAKGNQRKQVRLWLILALDSKTRKAIARKVLYDQPDRFSVGGFIRAVLLKIGTPDAIWLDRGKDYKSDHIQVAATELDIPIEYLPPRSPQLKGKIERFFGVLNTRLWKTLPGYTGSNTKERPAKVEAELTPDELLAKLDAFLDQYNHEIHSETERAPNNFWLEYEIFPVDPRKLDILLLESKSNKVQNRGIPYQGEYYWHADLHKVMGQYVDIYADPYEKNPEEIEVFYDGSWLCKAFSLKSGRGRLLTRNEIRSAQNQQSQTMNEAIKKAKEATKQYDQSPAILSELKKDEDGQTQVEPTDQAKPKKTGRKPPEKSQNSSQDKTDLWAQMPYKGSV